MHSGIAQVHMNKKDVWHLKIDFEPFVNDVMHRKADFTPTSWKYLYLNIKYGTFTAM